MSKNPVSKDAQRATIDQARIAAAKANGISEDKFPPTDYFLAIIKSESNGAAGAESVNGAVGLLQILPSTGVAVFKQNPQLLSTGVGGIPWDPKNSTHLDIAANRLRDPDFNIRTGLLLAAGNWNAQPASVKRSNDAVRMMYLDLQHTRGTDTAKQILNSGAVGKDGTVDPTALRNAIRTATIADPRVIGIKNSPGWTNSADDNRRLDGYMARFNPERFSGTQSSKLTDSNAKDADDEIRIVTKTIEIDGSLALRDLSYISYNSSSDNPTDNDLATDKQSVEEVKLGRLIETGLRKQLDTPAWHDRGNIVGNKNLANNSEQVTFEVLVDDAQRTFMTNSDGKNITVKLNVNLNKTTEHMAHVSNKTNTKTGFYITLWGMELDGFQGSGSTGAFYNQLGLASLPSMSITEDMKKAINAYLKRGTGSIETTKRGLFGGLKDFTQGLRKGADNFVYQSQQDVQKRRNERYMADYKNALNPDRTRKYTDAQLEQISDSFKLLQTEDIQSASPNDLNPDTLRVAAQDAFVELLMLFKNNGVRRYLGTDNFAASSKTGKYDKDLAASVWDSSIGATATQAGARANDVRERGVILMRMKGKVYQGYFKTFNWTMDAENPFMWDFNFNFVVLKSYRWHYLPDDIGLIMQLQRNAANRRSGE